MSNETLSTNSLYYLAEPVIGGISVLLLYLQLNATTVEF